MVDKILDADFRTQLIYPLHWKLATIDIYERLYSLGKVDQTEINRIEARLVEFRELRGVA